MEILKGQYIPEKTPKQHDVIFLGEKPSLYFVRHPEKRFKGNYNATETDYVFQKYIKKYLKQAVYVTDMVKTEGEAGADFENEWKMNPKFATLLLEELRKHNPRIIVAISQKIFVLFQRDPRFTKWKNQVRRIYHPSYVVRYKRFSAWDDQFRNICMDLK